MKVSLGWVLKLPVQISLRVEDLQVSVLAELVAEDGEKFQARSQPHRSGAEMSSAAYHRQDQDEEGTNENPSEEDVSPGFLNSLASIVGNSLVGQRRPECEFGSDSTSDFGSPDQECPFGLGSANRGHSLEPGLVNRESHFDIGLGDRGPNLYLGSGPSCTNWIEL